jgi:hypothetical protein
MTERLPLLYIVWVQNSIKVKVDGFLSHDRFSGIGIFKRTYKSHLYFTAFGAPRELLPASIIKPSVKPRQSPFSLPCGHPFGGGRSHSQFPFNSGWASAHAPVVLASTVGQCLGLAWVTCASSIGSAGLLASHLITPRQCLCLWRKPQFGVVESEAGRVKLPRPTATSTRHLHDTRSEEA